MRLGPAPDGVEIRTQADALHRAAGLAEPHMAALERYRQTIEARFGPTPHPDPADGGAAAELLILLETPGPRGSAPRFVSCDNPSGTARNLRRFLAQARIDRRRIALWNAVPWIIHAEGALNRSPRRREMAAGLAELPAFLGLMPDLRVVITAGRVAAGAAPLVRTIRPDLTLLAMPHPSPTYVCTSPTIPVRIRAVLEAAAALLDHDPIALQGRSGSLARESC